MKKIRTLAALATLTLAALPAAAQTTKIVTPPGSTTEVTTTPSGDQIITVTVNNEPVNFAAARPIMLSGRVMVPVRGVFEKLGGQVLWDPKERVVTGARAESSDQFRLRVGSSEALVNGQMTTLDAPPRIVGGTTYVPLRFVSEALGANVVWDNAKRTVIITSDGAAATVKTGGM
jgi:hypothetical protein